MNRLAYAYKFGVMVMLFAVPLVVLLAQIFIDSNQELKQAALQSRGVESVTRSHALIGNLQQWRDTIVLNYLSSSPEITALHVQSSQTLEKALKEMTLYLKQHENEQAAEQLAEIAARLREPSIGTGMEGVSIELVYDNAHRYVEEFYDWQRQLAAGYGLFGVQDSATYGVMNLLLYDMADANEVLGKVRAFGSYFLKSGFIDSAGIYILDKTYTHLEKEIEKISDRLAAREGPAGPRVNEERAFMSALNGLLDIYDERLIQVTELDSSWEAFFDETGRLMEATRELEATWLLTSLRFFQQIENKRERDMQLLLSFTVVLVVLILLLYSGFYYSVKKTITQLVDSAEAVAAGDFDRAMRTHTRDELSLLGRALDHMREQLKARQSHLHEMSITDGLTGLKNRKYFDEVLEAETNKAVRGNYPLALIMVDIDHFKAVNDDYGHMVGDECLRFVAAKLKEFAKRASDIAARYGGEEFAIILPDSSVEACFEIAEQLRKSVQDSDIQVGEILMKLTVSCGVASMVPRSLKEMPDLLRTADEALYDAKRSGRNCSKLKNMGESPLQQHA